MVITLDNKAFEDILARLREMRLPEMANQLIMMKESGELYTMSALEVLDRLTGEEKMSRRNNTIQRYLKASKMSQPYATLNGFKKDAITNKSVFAQLCDDTYITRKRNIIVLGACGTGKSYLVNAFVADACSHLHTALYCRMFELLTDTNNERLTAGETSRTIRKYTRPEVLVIDDFMNVTLTEKESLDLFKILEYRYSNASTIIASQFEPREWHNKMQNPILADSILDRVTGGAYTLVLTGDSLRQKAQ